MQRTGFHIETILAKDLYTFFCEYAAHAEGQKISPISKYRALSQSKNPYAAEDAPGLLVAYSGDECVGYQGILPGILRTQNGEAKVYWCTAAYVLPEFRKRMVAIHLIKKLISLKKDIVLTGFDQLVADVFKGMHFQEMQPLEYLTARVDRLDLFAFPFRRFYRLQKRWPALRRIAEGVVRFSARWCYPSVRAAFYRMVERRIAQPLMAVRWEETSCVKRPFDNNLASPSAVPSFVRDVDVVNWMLEYPWIQDGPPPTHPPYYFSEAYARFRYFVLSIGGAEGESADFAVLSLTAENNESKLKVLDFDCRKENDGALFWLVWKYAAQFKVDEIELPLRWESLAASLPFASLLVKRARRRYLCHPSSDTSPLAVSLPHLNLDLCDGDSAFT